jgi:hypothetical protein
VLTGARYIGSRGRFKPATCQLQVTSVVNGEHSNGLNSDKCGIVSSSCVITESVHNF